MIDGCDTTAVCNESKGDSLNYTQMASNYIVIENKPTGPPQTYTFPTLGELRVWANAGVGEVAGADTAAQVKQELFEKIKAVFGIHDAQSPEYMRIFDMIMSNIIQLSYKKGTDEDVALYKKRAEQDPLYVHYAMLHELATTRYDMGTYTNATHVCRKVLSDIKDKKLGFPWTQFTSDNSNVLAVQTLYGHYVETLFKHYNRLAPELAYGMYMIFELEHKSEYNFLDLFLPKQSDVEKQWLQLYLETFYVMDKDGSIKRAEFIKDLQNHIEELKLDLLKYSRHSDWSALEKLAGAPEKILGLVTVRKAPGMFITGIRKKTPVATAVTVVEQRLIETPPLPISEVPNSIVSRFTGPPTIEIVGDMLKDDYHVNFKDLTRTPDARKFPIEKGSYVFKHNTTGAEYTYTYPGKGMGYWVGSYSTSIPEASATTGEFIQNTVVERDAHAVPFTSIDGKDVADPFEAFQPFDGPEREDSDFKLEQDYALRRKYGIELKDLAWIQDKRSDGKNPLYDRDSFRFLHSSTGDIYIYFNYFYLNDDGTYTNGGHWHKKDDRYPPGKEPKTVPYEEALKQMAIQRTLETSETDEQHEIASTVKKYCEKGKYDEARDYVLGLGKDETYSMMFLRNIYNYRGKNSSTHKKFSGLGKDHFEAWVKKQAPMDGYCYTEKDYETMKKMSEPDKYYEIASTVKTLCEESKWDEARDYLLEIEKYNDKEQIKMFLSKVYNNYFHKSKELLNHREKQFGMSVFGLEHYTAWVKKNIPIDGLVRLIGGKGMRGTYITEPKLDYEALAAQGYAVGDF